ncbi:MAG TPA: Holliday junction resolvase RuvX [Bacteroidota bacterium]|nr:Holliday junction resolvase RuvX [Bacteroidota bacterium]
MDKRILGIDYGSVKVGVAVSDPLRIIAQSVGTYPNNASLVDKVATLAEEYDVGVVVVGMPFNLKGEKGAKAQEVDAFVEQLKRRLRADVVTWDERFTSRIAEQTLIQMGTTRKQRRTDKGRVDAMASALILQSFLDQTKHSLGC